MQDYVEVARAGQTIIVRVNGLGNMANALPFWDLAEQELEKGADTFAVDLFACTGMDSTFMGTIVGVARALGELERGKLTVLNPSQVCASLLEMVGADRFVEISNLSLEPELEMQRLPNVRGSVEARLRLIRRAHERLVEIDKRNQEKFGPFLKALVAELERS